MPDLCRQDSARLRFPSRAPLIRAFRASLHHDPTLSLSLASPSMVIFPPSVGRISNFSTFTLLSSSHSPSLHRDELCQTNTPMLSSSPITRTVVCLTHPSGDMSLRQAPYFDHGHHHHHRSSSSPQLSTITIGLLGIVTQHLIIDNTMRHWLPKATPRVPSTPALRPLSDRQLLHP